MTESFSPKAVYLDMSEIKVTRRMADLVLEILECGMTSYDVLGETMTRCYEAGLVETREVDGCITGPHVTAPGQIVAQVELDKRAAEKAKRSKSAYARTQAMLSVGMRRARSGAWE